jgi:Autographiviridae endonuclease
MQPDDTRFRVKRSCEVCGAPFVARADNIAKGYGRYCSHACANKARVLPEAQRFWALVDKRGPDECWPWLAAIGHGGYGAFTRDGRRQVGAHRMAYELAYGPVPIGKNACHRCDKPSCCNPAHLFSGTDAENIADRDAKGRTQLGERHWLAKLTEDDIRSIRARHAADGVSQTALAAEYGVTQATVSAIILRKTWRYVV